MGCFYTTLKILEDNPAVLKVIQNKWDFIQIDECQDTNYAQFKFVELISSSHNNVFIVGDIDQSIYMFRSARYQNIVDFIKKHDDCAVIPLGQNYRSTPEIIKAANTLIKHNSSHMDVNFYTDNPSGHDVTVVSSINPSEEAKK